MCWICNPVCGRCKPPIQVIQCPACSSPSFVSMIKCRKCGAVLPEQVEGAADLCSL